MITSSHHRSSTSPLAPPYPWLHHFLIRTACIFILILFKGVLVGKMAYDWPNNKYGVIFPSMNLTDAYVFNSLVFSPFVQL
jgi:hypothetical protein